MEVKLERSTQEYFENLKKQVDEVYRISNEARSKGYDPVDEVEIPLAMNMAEKVVGLISTIYPQVVESEISKRIIELEDKYGKLHPTVMFKIAEEVSEQKFCKFEKLKDSIDAGIRIGLAYTTLGVVSSPIEGYTGIEIGKRRDGKEYLIANFSGPIRSAGTTASCLGLILIDFLREKYGFEKYDPTQKEIRRVYTELLDFHERITNLQYMPTEEEALFLAENLPIQVAGEPSEKMEVSNYKNLPRVSTNFLRSGVCLVLGEGLAQKAAKGFRLLNQARKNGIKCSGFDFLEEYIELHEKRTLGKDKKSGPPTYIKDLVAGRPIYGHPSMHGGLRFRYGRGRNSGFSATCVHPATMGISDDFLAIGTQLKIEKPTKGCAIAVCDKMEGPIVKLKNGGVIQLTKKDEARKIYKKVKEILYLGDFLFPLSDVQNRNAQLIRSGYVEEWWALELEKAGGSVEDPFNVSLEEAIGLSKKYKVPLHPKFIFYWNEISPEEFESLLRWIKSSRDEENLVLDYSLEKKESNFLGKRALELLGVVHEVKEGEAIVNKEKKEALFLNLGLTKENLFKKIDKILSTKGGVLERVNLSSDFLIKDKSGEFIGARMGRPEKAKLRKLVGSPNVLFPVGSEGGRLRSVYSATEVGYVSNQFPNYFCEECKEGTIYRVCEKCGNRTKKQYYFSDVKEKSYEKIFKYSQREGLSYSFQRIDIKNLLDRAKEKIGFTKNEMPDLIKGIRGMSSEEKVPENLAKGILRAKYDLQVNKDGTIRMDATELPLTAFRPREIGTSIEKLRELGYKKDMHGDELKNESQIVELMPHDVLIPSSPETPNELGEDVFMKICSFIDDLLEKFYGLPRFYNVKKKEDLVGKLGVCMAPHNCAGVVCRFIGFSNTLGLMASPYMHAAIRRDCDGDEAALMLLGDVLINFSRKFLPGHRGGTQDAPLVLNSKIDAGEVDDQILDFEVLNKYPLELYQLAEREEHSSQVEVRTISKVLKEGKDPFVGLGFTHDTTDFNDGVVCSSYKLFENMMEKVDKQMALVEKLRSVDAADTARLIIERHFIRDIRGNLRGFSNQGFRCVACNEIERRPPLSGKCSKCGGKLIFTIHEGGIKKYLEPALALSKKYNLSPYLQQVLGLVKGYVDSVFGKEKEKQTGLGEFV